jgi:hypothetical protein
MRINKHWIRSLAIAFVATLIGNSAPAKDLPPIKTVGIVSDVGDKMHFQHIGFMVFSNAHTAIDVPDWKTDAYITGLIEAALKDRYTLSVVDFSRGAIAPDLEPSLFSSPSPEDNVRANAKPANGQPIDAYVVVWPRRNEVYPTNQQVEGIGILTQGERARLFSALVVTLIDGHTFKEIDDCWARVRPTSFGEPDGSYMNQANDLYAESYDAMTADQKQKLEQGLKAMISDGIAYCLRDLKLAN